MCISRCVHGVHRPLASAFVHPCRVIDLRRRGCLQGRGLPSSRARPRGRRPWVLAHRHRLPPTPPTLSATPRGGRRHPLPTHFEATSGGAEATSAWPNPKSMSVSARRGLAAPPSGVGFHRRRVGFHRRWVEFHQARVGRRRLRWAVTRARWAIPRPSLRPIPCGHFRLSASVQERSRPRAASFSVRPSARRSGCAGRRHRDVPAARRRAGPGVAAGAAG